MSIRRSNDIDESSWLDFPRGVIGRLSRRWPTNQSKAVVPAKFSWCSNGTKFWDPSKRVPRLSVRPAATDLFQKRTVANLNRPNSLLSREQSLAFILPHVLNGWRVLTENCRLPSDKSQGKRNGKVEEIQISVHAEHRRAFLEVFKGELANGTKFL